MHKSDMSRLASIGAAFALTLSMTPTVAAAPMQGSLDAEVAAHSTTTVQTALVGPNTLSGLSVDQLVADSLTAQVERAASFKDVKRILQRDGYRIDRSASSPDTVRFVKRSGGAAVVFDIWTQDEKDRMTVPEGLVQPAAKVGWNWIKGGPYVEATAGEWKEFVKYGVNWSSPLCGLIGNVLGAVGCGVVANVVSSYLDTIDTRNWPPTMCIAVSVQLRTWIEKC